MAVKIRLQRKGRAKAPFYHLVVADSRSPRDGKYIERIGSYNPMTKPATIEIDREAAYNWLVKGAQPTDTARAILRFKGVLVKKHLNRGVAKGAFSQEEADKRWAAWIDAKENKISERRDSHKAEKAAKHKSIHGEAKAKPVVVDEAPAVEEVVETIDEAVNATEEVAVEVATPEVVETPVVEEAPAVVEEVVETPVAEEAPVAETPVAEAEEAPVAEEPVQENPEASTEEEEKA